MSKKTGKPQSVEELTRENAELRARLEEAEEALRAIREGEVDAIVVSGKKGDQVFSLSGADSVYRLIVETMKEAALTIAFDGTVLFSNSQFADLIHTPHEKILGKRLSEFVCQEKSDDLAAMIRRSQTESVKQYLLFKSAQGSLVPAHISANVLHRPDGVSICIVATDLTELETSTEMLGQLRIQREALGRSEQRYRQLAEDLESRVQERTAELSKTVDRLNEEIQRSRSMEEELRVRSNQLSRMAAQLTIAEEQERRRITAVLHDNVQQLLVGAKLCVAGMRRSPERAEQAAAELDQILTQSIDLTRSLTSELSPPVLRQSGFAPALQWLGRWMKERHGLNVELKAARDLQISNENTGILLFQAVRELLFNVVKHARVSNAQVSAECIQDRIRIQVSDTGAGFDPAQLPAQSDRFGLFSIRERFSSIGGSVQVESAPGQGCRITLLVPERSTPAPMPERAPSEPRAIRILIVDDHVIMRQGLAQLIRTQPDMDVVGEASDGQSAIRMARQYLPDVIVMDMSMPIMSGVEATRIIHVEPISR